MAMSTYMESFPFHRGGRRQAGRGIVRPALPSHPESLRHGECRRTPLGQMPLDPAAERLPDKALAEKPDQVIGFDVPKRRALEWAEGQDELAGVVLKAVSLFQSK